MFRPTDNPYFFGRAVGLPVFLGILLVIYGFRGHPAIIGVGAGMVLVPVLGTWIWSRHADRAEQRERSSQPPDPDE